MRMQLYFCGPPRLHNGSLSTFVVARDARSSYVECHELDRMHFEFSEFASRAEHGFFRSFTSLGIHLIRGDAALGCRRKAFATMFDSSACQEIRSCAN